VFIVVASLVEAQLAIDRQPDLRRIAVFLAVVFPPAYRAQSQRAWRLESLESAARATIRGRNNIHVRIDEESGSLDYRKAGLDTQFPPYKSILTRGPLVAIVFIMKELAECNSCRLRQR
jgi:hypothetical protein